MTTLSNEQIRKGGDLWHSWKYDTLKIAEFLGVDEAIVWNNLTAIRISGRRLRIVGAK